MPSSVYLLFHIRPSGKLLLIGVYATEEGAKTAVEGLKDKSGFVDYPDGFEYHSYEVGVETEEWKDGFIDDESDEPEDEESGGVSGPPERPN
jgi:hypothetical protein